VDFESDYLPLPDPVAAHDRIVTDQRELPPPLNWTPDVSLVAGGTIYLPSDLAYGEHPEPWNSPVADADRRAGANRGAIAP
jgi:hypothetical protein